MEVDSDSEVGAGDLAHGCDPLNGLIDLAVRVDVVEFLGCVHLDRREAGVDLLPHGVGDVCRTVTTDPVVDADGVARCAPQ